MKRQDEQNEKNEQDQKQQAFCCFWWEAEIISDPSITNQTYCLITKVFWQVKQVWSNKSQTFSYWTNCRMSTNHSTVHCTVMHTRTHADAPACWSWSSCSPARPSRPSRPPSFPSGRARTAAPHTAQLVPTWCRGGVRVQLHLSRCVSRAARRALDVWTERPAPFCLRVTSRRWRGAAEIPEIRSIKSKTFLTVIM